MQFIKAMIVLTAIIVGFGIFNLVWHAKFHGTGKRWYSRMFYAGLIGTTLTMVLGFLRAKLTVNWMNQTDFSAVLYIREIDRAVLILAALSLVCFAIWVIDKILDFFLPRGS